MGGGPATAVRGEVPDAVGETYGVRGVSNSPDGAGMRADNNVGGPDLLLGGAPAAELTEAGFARESDGNFTFDFSNPGTGTMTLQVDGSPVLTTGTDPWVDEAGDAMTGTLNLTGTAGYALDIGPTSDVNLGLTTRVFKDGVLFLHDLGNDNFGAGRAALANVSTGFFNTAVGNLAAYANAGGNANTALGNQALTSNTGGGNNTALGSGALASNTTGNANTALGHYALDSNTTGLGNTAVGQDALQANAVGAKSVAVGFEALSLAVGEFNVAVGTDAADSLTTGSFNIALGSSAGTDWTGAASNNIAIGNDGIGSDNDRIRIGDTADPGAHTETFIAGIRANVVPAGTLPVQIDANGELGTVSCGSYQPAAACPVADGLDGPQCDEVAVGSFCETDGECGLNASLNNCGTAEWYVRTG